MSGQSGNPAERDELLDEAVAAYFEAVEAGQSIDQQAWLARYVEVAPELAEFFADQKKIRGWAEPLRGSARRIARDSGRGRQDGASPLGDEWVAGLDDYELIEEINRGGMGVVYKARQSSLNRIVAIKMILAGRLAGFGDVQRFRTEAKAAASLDHPNITPIYEVGEHEGRPYFSMKLIEGGSLVEHLSRFEVDQRASARLLATVARAVHHAHQRGILHRDLKPANILLDRDGQPYVTDFGLARSVQGDSGITQSGAILGTPSYMAPEQAAGSKTLTTSADIYSLGALLYALLTGRPPFHTDTPMETVRRVLEDEPSRPRLLNSRVDRDLETICLKCLNKEPQRRYGSAEGLAEDLERWLCGRPIHARRSTLWERTIKRARRNPAMAALLAVSALALLTLAAAGVLYQEKRAREAENELTEQMQRFNRERETMDFIADAKEHMAQEQWQAARVPLEMALAKETSDPVSRKLSAAARQLLHEIDDRLREQQLRRDAAQRFAQFVRGKDEALFQGTLFTGVDLPANIQATQRAAEEALSLFGLVPSGQGRRSLDTAYSDQERAFIEEGCYELLLILAETHVQREPSQAGEALRLLERATELGPPTKAYHLRRARYLNAIGQQAAADLAAQQAALLEPARALDHFLLGYDFMQQQRLSAATAAFDHALRADPDHFWARYLLALCFLQQSHPETAKAHLTACLNQRPDFVWCYYHRGMAEGELQQFAAAEEDFQRALELAPTDPAQAEKLRYGVLVNRAVRARQRGLFGDAIDHLHDAAALKPDWFQAYWNLANVYQQLSQPDAAIEQLDKAIEAAQSESGGGAIDPSTRALLYRHRAELHFEHQDRAAASRDVQRALQLEPYAETYVLQAETAEQIGDFLAAAQAYEAALNVEPANANAYTRATAYGGLARALLELQKYKEAIQFLDRCLEENAQPEAHIYQLRGLARAKMHDYPGAISDYTQALTFRPHDSFTHAYRGWVYLVQDARQPALADFEEAIRLDPENGDAYAGRGYVRVSLGDHAGAVRDAEEALQRGPRTNRMLWNAARIHAQLVAFLDSRNAYRRWTRELLESRNRYETRAVQLLEQALALTPDDQQRSFWRTYIQPDSGLASIRRSTEFVELENEYTREPE